VNLHLKPYHKKLPYSYVYGVSATLELLAARPEHALGVVLSSRGTRNTGVARIRDQCARHHLEVETNDKVIERISPKDNHLAVGVFRKYHSHIKPSQNLVALVQPSDMGNLGTIIRTMVGFGFVDLAVIRPAADLFHPRTIRASMGAVFRLSFECFDNFDSWRQSASAHNLYTFMTDGRTSISQVHFEPPFALVFGNESTGLADRFHGVGTSVAIAHRGQVDSLNLSVAAAIALYEGAKSKDGSGCAT
jgi:TrmH family RNA methyltransferase